MGAKRNSQEKKDKAIAHWKAGRSQRWIADTVGCSPASVNSWVKGIPQDNAELVNTQVVVNEKKAQLTEQELNAVTEHVEERTKHIQFFTNATLKNVSLMAKKLTPQTTILEHRQAQATLKDAKEVVMGKDPTTAVQVNNNIGKMGYIMAPNQAESSEVWQNQVQQHLTQDP